MPMNEGAVKAMVASLLDGVLKNSTKPRSSAQQEPVVVNEQREIVSRLISIQGRLVEGIALDADARDDMNFLLDQMIELMERANIQRN